MNPGNKIEKQTRRIRFFIPVLFISVVLMVGGIVIGRIFEVPETWAWIVLVPAAVVFFGYLFQLIWGHFACVRASEVAKARNLRAFLDLSDRVDGLTVDEKTRLLERCLEGEDPHKILDEARQSQSRV